LIWQKTPGTICVKCNKKEEVFVNYEYFLLHISSFIVY